MKEYTVYYHGRITVEAEDESEARGEAYDRLQEACIGEFSTDEVEEEGEVEE